MLPKTFLEILLFPRQLGKNLLTYRTSYPVRISRNLLGYFMISYHTNRAKKS